MSGDILAELNLLSVVRLSFSIFNNLTLLISSRRTFMRTGTPYSIGPDTGIGASLQVCSQSSLSSVRLPKPVLETLPTGFVSGWYAMLAVLCLSFPTGTLWKIPLEPINQWMLMKSHCNVRSVHRLAGSGWFYRRGTFNWINTGNKKPRSHPHLVLQDASN